MGNRFSSPSPSSPPPPSPSASEDPPCSSGKLFLEKQRERDAKNPSSSSSCPVPEDVRRSKFGVYNVYNQRIDARNNMPADLSAQRKAPGQKKWLSTARASSTIPKSGMDGKTWQYPSSQMFYNALVRKGKADDVEETDVDSVVSVHNVMNEETWEIVRRWERLHEGETRGEEPKLVRFRGRPDDMSPLAWARYALSGGKPFDRHDWWIERGNKEVRYVVDYYFREDKAGTSEQFELVVRPALDSATSALDRVKMFTYVNCARFGVPCPITGSATIIGEENEGNSGVN